VLNSWPPIYIGEINITRGIFNMETLPHHLTQRFDDLNASLNQIDALLNIVMSVDLTELKPDVLLNYLWVVSNIILTAKKVCEELLNKLTVPIS
jgi:hypothetical protein